MELCLNPDKKSTKELLISILSSNWPLSAKELFFQLKKTGISVTYQAVHKSLTELQKKGIVEKEHNKYLINIEWINELIDYCGQLENNYLAGIPKRKEDIPDKVIFNKLFMIYIFFMEVLTKNTFNKEDPKRIVCFKDF